MSTPFVGEIRMFGGNFAPVGWAFCNGQLIAIAENDTLFNLIGTTYGGDGVTTFGLPDLQGRVPIHQGTGSDGTPYVIGERSGVESVTLTTNQMPIHTHPFLASTDPGTIGDPANQFLATSGQVKIYTPFPPTIPMNANSASAAGGSQPHDNMMPFLVVSFIISLFGIFPSQN
jgi:microcystin-dependent protein